MTELLITRGLPGCGKTYYASAWVAEDPGRRARVNRDDLRSMIHDGAWIKGVTEPRILVARDALVSALLKRGVSVVVDDTNLPQRTVRDLAKLAKRAGAELRVVDFTHVPVETCIERDAKRDRAVGEDVIRGMHLRYLRGRDLPLPLPEEGEGELAGVVRYEEKPGTPKAVMVDIDGTVALMTDRSPFDETRVHEDLPNLPVIKVVRALHAAGHRVVFLSGRRDACQAETEKWLAEHVGVPYEGLFMRRTGDGRKDSIVKAELFDQHVRDVYDVACVLDDRDQVVRMWRDLGLTVLQVADGAF
ncbi:AAA family ATPase [Streptosporangium sp. CA-115845]|uniref:phosphatase domain-containing protein n=1 Tax=Streptosporangium sp. CA-115845 TaxID=3240071 RepID=UPI003D910817